MRNYRGFQVLSKGRKLHDEVKSSLEDRVREELHAMRTYMCQASFFMSIGCSKLANKMWAEAQEEMKHAMMLLDRLHMFGGHPEVGEVPDVPESHAVKEALDHQQRMEEDAIEKYNKLAKIARVHGDHETARIAEKILKDEEEHWDWVDGEIDKIRNMGIQNYLAEQSEHDDEKAWR